MYGRAILVDMSHKMVLSENGIGTRRSLSESSSERLAISSSSS